MEKATPGPWRVRQSLVDSTYTHVCSDKDNAIACTKTEANAALVAAAPDLLESLTNLVGLAEVRGPIHEYKAALKDAKAAIAKASAANSYTGEGK